MPRRPPLWLAGALLAPVLLAALPLSPLRRGRRMTDRAHEERFSLALDAGGMGTWDWDMRSGTIVWAGHHERVMGVPEGQFDGRYETFARAVHPDDLPDVEAAVAHARDTRSVYKQEYRVLWPDGSVHWAAGRGRFLYDQAGQPVRMLGVIQDVTEQREAAERVRLADAERDALLHRLQLVMDQMPIGCVIVDLDIVVSYWNAAAERIFGFSSAEMLGRSGYGLVIPEATRPYMAQLVEQLSSGASSSVMVAENLTQDGRHILCEWHNAALRGPDGKTIGILGMFQDVTERERREEEIARLNAELEHRVAERTAELAAKHRELEVFTYSVSHDLKAPLRGLEGYSRLLQEDYGDRLDDEGRFFVKTIRDAARQMGALIDDLLAYSRLERRALHLRPVVVAQVGAAVCAEFEAEAQSRGARLRVELAPGKVLAEPEGLAQALRNLLDNALKFSRTVATPEIQVGGGPEAGRYLLWVRDNGAGFSMEYHDRIFEIFQRLQRAEEYPGTGVGLAIVRKAMERLGGSVWAESAPGAGATFYLGLPLVTQEER